MKNALKVSLLVLALASAHAQAVETRLDGKYFDIIYDSASLGLFGTPTLSGNTLFFTPTTFSAESSSMSTFKTGSTISFWIVADDGHHLTGASLLEQGDYNADKEDDKSARVAVGGQTRFVDNNHPGSSTSAAIVGAGVSDLPANGFSSTSDWAATSLQTFQSGATKIKFTIENLLFANAGSQSNYAFIEKKYVGLTVSAVPEPESYAMLLAGLGILGAVVRRKKMPA